MPESEPSTGPVSPEGEHWSAQHEGNAMTSRDVWRALLFPWTPSAVAPFPYPTAWRVLGGVLIAVALVPAECSMAKRVLAYLILMTSVALASEAIRQSTRARRVVNRVLQVAIAVLIGFGMLCFRGVGELAAAVALRTEAAFAAVSPWPVMGGAILSGVVAALWIASTSTRAAGART